MRANHMLGEQRQRRERDDERLRCKSERAKVAERAAENADEAEKPQRLQRVHALLRGRLRQLLQYRHLLQVDAAVAPDRRNQRDYYAHKPQVADGISRVVAARACAIAAAV